MTAQSNSRSHIIVPFFLVFTTIKAMVYGISLKNKRAFLQKLLGTIFLILICLSPPQVKAQSNVDSLKSIVEDVSLSYKERVKATMKLSSFYNYKDVDSSYYYRQQAYDLAKRNADDSLTVEALYFLGNGWNFRNEFDKAIDYLNQALQKAEDMGTSYYLGRIYTDLGMAYDRKGDPVEGLQFLQKALDVHTANKDIFGQADAHYEMGSVMLIRGEYTEAAKHFRAAKKGFNKLGYIEDVIFCNGSLGVTLQDSFPEQALVAYQEVAYMADSLNMPGISAKAYGAIGQLNSKLSHLPEAEKALQRSIELYKKVGKKTGEMEGYKWLGSTYFKKKDFQKSIKYCKLAQEFYANGDYILMNLQSCRCLYQAHQGAKNYEKALDYALKFQSLNDSLFSKQKTTELTEAKLNFEFENEKEILALQKQKDEEVLLAKNKQTRNIALGIGALALLTLGFFWNARRKNKIISTQNTAISQQNKQLEQLNTTKDRIFAIIGHDLRKPAIAFRGITKKVNYLLKNEDYKTLNALGEEIERDALALNKLTDNLLNWALIQRDVLPHDPKEIHLAPIVEEINSIFSGIAKDKNIELSFEIPDDLQVYADANALRTVVRNLLDNALKYTPAGGSVIIKAIEENGETKISVSDSGVGMSAEKIQDIFLLKKEKSEQGTAGEKGTGLGMYLVNELVKLNEGTIQVASQLNKGTTFELLLPNRKVALG